MRTNEPLATEIADISTPNPTDIRQKHLGHEANIRAIGLLLYLNAVSLFIAGLAWPIFTISMALGPPNAAKPDTLGIAIVALISLACLALGVGFFRAARQLRRLENSGRWAAYTMAGLQLLNIPIGTLVGIVVLYFTVGKKASYVLSPEYREIIAKTPEIVYKWSIITKIAIGLLIAVLLMGLIGVITFFVVETFGFSQ